MVKGDEAPGDLPVVKGKTLPRFLLSASLFLPVYFYQVQYCFLLKIVYVVTCSYVICRSIHTNILLYYINICITIHLIVNYYTQIAKVHGVALAV